MARARNFAAEYARRKANGLARGLSLQAARGHVAREHLVRAERRTARGLLTSSELQWLNRQLARTGARAGLTAEERRHLAREAFERMTPAERAAIRAEQRKRSRRGDGAPNDYGMSPMSVLVLARRSGPQRMSNAA